MESMFFDCNELIAIYGIDKWNVSALTTMETMFSECYNLKCLDLSRWNISNVTNIDGVFWECYSLLRLDLSGWDTSSITEYDDIFYDCTELKMLTLPKVLTFDADLPDTMWNIQTSSKMAKVTSCNAGNTVYYWTSSDTIRGICYVDISDIENPIVYKSSDKLYSGMFGTLSYFYFKDGFLYLTGKTTESYDYSYYLNCIAASIGSYYIKTVCTDFKVVEGTSMENMFVQQSTFVYGSKTYKDRYIYTVQDL
jgi:surface protein